MTWRSALESLAILAIIAAVLYTAYDYGQQTKNAEWQQRWSDRDAADRQAWALAETAEREKEQARQQSINKVIQDGQKAIDSALADASAARATATSLREQADKLAGYASSKASSHSCTAAAGQAASRAVMVLADVLNQSVQRNTELAEFADQSRARGLMCEAAYQGIVN